MPDQPTQFEMLYDALCSKFPGLASASDANTVFQFAMAPVAAQWGPSKPADLYSLANSVSTDLGGFWTPQPGLDRAYRSLLTSIKPANYVDNPDLIQAQQQYQALNDQLADIVQQAHDAYSVYKADNAGAGGLAPETFAAWLLDPAEGHSYQLKMDAVQKKMTVYDNKITEITTSMDAALSDARRACNPETMTDTMVISTGGATPVRVPNFRISGNLDQDLVNWTGRRAGENDFSVTLDKNRTIVSKWKTLYQTQAQADCWGASTKTNVNTSRIITEVNYKMDVSFVGLQAYQISPGTWYNPSYVDPAVEITPGATVTNDTFFGASGSLHLIPSLVLVGYRPTFTLTTSTEVYQQQFEANANADVQWVSMLGWRFDVKGLASLQPMAQANGTTTVTFNSPQTSTPQILGVVSKVAWNGHQ